MKQNKFYILNKLSLAISIFSFLFAVILTSIYFNFIPLYSIIKKNISLFKLANMIVISLTFLGLGLSLFCIMKQNKNKLTSISIALTGFILAVYITITLLPVQNIIKEKKIASFKNKVKIYTLRIKNDPTNYEAYVDRGIAYAKLDLQDLAVEDYNKAIEFNKNFFEAYYERANVYSDSGQFDWAIEDYRKALKRAPNIPHIHFQLALTYDALQKDKFALNSYKTFITLYNENKINMIEMKQYAKKRINELSGPQAKN